MKKILKKISIVCLAFVLISLPFIGYAQVGNPPPSGGGGSTEIKVGISNPFNCGSTSQKDCTLLTLIRVILQNIVMPIAAVAITMWIIWAGFQFVTAQGNEKKITDAKQNLLWSLIGAGILLGAAGISVVVENTVRALLK